MKILFVCMQYIHSARWVNQLKNSEHEIYLFDCLDAPIHKDLLWTNYTTNWSKRKVPNLKGEHFLKKKAPKLYKKIAPYLQVTASEKLEELIKKIKPDLVHSLEMQSETYPLISVRNKANFLWAYSCWGNDIFFNKEKNTEHSKNLLIDESILLSYFTSNITLNTQTTLWKKQVLLNYKFNEKLHRAQELDFFSRIMLKEKLNGGIINEKLVLIREHENSITGGYLRGDEIKIFNDISVRFNIFNNINKSIPKHYKDKIFYLYLKTIHNALLNKFYLKTLSHLFKSLFKVNFSYKVNMLKVIFFCFIYILTGKGWERMKKML